MAKKCFKRQVTDPNAITTDSVVWTGEDLECLDICNGESITPLMFNIATEVCRLIEITNVEDTTLCTNLIERLGTQNKTIGNLLQILQDEVCSLRTFTEEVQKETNTSIGLTLDFKCISTQIDPCASTDITNISQVLQVLINAFCELKEEFTEVDNSLSEAVENTIVEYLDGLFESDQPNRILKITGTTPKFKFRGFVPPNCPIPYVGSMTYFSAGVGTGPFSGWYVCNGQNGTFDMRGVVPVGAIQGTAGGSLPSNVNPTLNPMTPSTNYALGDRGGRVSVGLTTTQIPSHSHPLTVTNEPHIHTYNQFYITADSADPNIVYPSGSGSGAGLDIEGSTAQRKTANNPNAQTSTSSANTTVSMAAVGGGQAHENRMPYAAVVWIQMID